MFRACISQGKSNPSNYSLTDPERSFHFSVSRPLASTSTRLPSTSTSFHTAAVLHATRRQGQSVKKRNTQRMQERHAKEAEDQPSVILGTRPHEEAELWSNCDLAKCLVNPHNLNGPPVAPSAQSPSSTLTSSNLAETIEIPELGASVQVPKDANYGIGEFEKKMLFEELPVLSAQAPFLSTTSHFNSVFDAKMSLPPTDILAQRQKEAIKKETAKLDAFARVIDLRNANAQGIAYENRRRIVLQFSASENPFDPGRAEVQGELRLSFAYFKLTTISLFF